MPSPIVLQVPLELPSPARMEELYLEAARAAVAQRDAWLDVREASAYLRMSRASFDRKRRQLGLPASKVGGCLAFYRADLDVLRLSHISAPEVPGGAILDFPSLKGRAAAVAGGEVIHFPSTDLKDPRDAGLARATG